MEFGTGCVKVTPAHDPNDFEMGKRYCHSGDIIQGGFVTAMLDAVCAHVVFGTIEQVRALSTLELKVTFYEASRAGKFSAIGKIDKMGSRYIMKKKAPKNRNTARIGEINAAPAAI